jgi:hypothetical protein
MRIPSILHSLIWLGAMVFAFTILTALGTAVFALLGGTLCWLFRVERVPISFLWATTSGAIAGFLTGIVWAIDRALNWGGFSPPSQDDSHWSATPSTDSKASQISSLRRPKKNVDAE